jgi:uncharacterized protein YjbI with pentapeptide repeats
MTDSPISKDAAVALLIEGKVAEWNVLRQNHVDWNPELIEVNLSGVQLCNIDFKGANLTRAIVKGANLAGADLQRAILFDTDLEGALLQGADLSNTLCSKPDPNIPGSKFEDSQPWSLMKPNFNGANLKGVRFRAAHLKGVSFHNAIVEGVDFSESYLDLANFKDCVLTGAVFRGASLRKVSLVNADLSQVDLRGAKGLTREQLESVKRVEKMLFDDEEFRSPRLPETVPQIFLSYTRADESVVMLVDQWLRDKGARVIIDERNFVAGENVHQEIIRWIQNAGVIVCFISKDSIDRPYPVLERELGNNLLIKGKARLIYFKLDETHIDIHHEERIYIQGDKMTFEEACEKLWQGVMKTVKPPKSIDLNAARMAGKDWIKRS